MFLFFVGTSITIWNYIAEKSDGISKALIILLLVTFIYWIWELLFWAYIYFIEIYIDVFAAILGLIVKGLIVLAFLNLAKGMHNEGRIQEIADDIIGDSPAE